MTLKDYLSERGTLAALARKLGVSAGTVHDLKEGRRTPSLPLALAIERETGGKVLARSFVPAEATQ